MKVNRELLRSLPYRVRDRIAMQPLVQRALLPFGRELCPDRWIFIIGCYNSGTTLLANILREHRMLTGLPTEGVYLTDALPYPEQYGWPRNWAQCADRMRLDPQTSAGRAERIQRQWSLWMPRGATNIIEKSIANAARLPFLDAHFRPAYFIYIVRNGYAVSAGIRQRANVGRWGGEYQDSRYPMALCAEQWRVSDETVETDSNGLEHFQRIYYEDLVADPAATMMQITDFLDITPFTPEAIARSWTVHGVVAPIMDMNASACARLDASDVDIIDQVAGARLALHGYARPAGDTRCEGVAVAG